MATNAIYGFTNMLLKVIRELQPDHLAVIYDSKGPTFRKDIYPEYKANRSAMPDDMVPQIPYIKRVVAALNFPGSRCPDSRRTISSPLWRKGSRRRGWR